MKTNKDIYTRNIVYPLVQYQIYVYLKGESRLTYILRASTAYIVYTRDLNGREDTGRQTVKTSSLRKSKWQRIINNNCEVYRV